MNGEEQKGGSGAQYHQDNHNPLHRSTLDDCSPNQAADSADNSIDGDRRSHGRNTKSPVLVERSDVH